MSTTLFMWLFLASLAGIGGVFAEHRWALRKLARTKIQEAIARASLDTPREVRTESASDLTPKAGETEGLLRQEVEITITETVRTAFTPEVSEEALPQPEDEEERPETSSSASGSALSSQEVKALLNRAEILLAHHEFIAAEKLFIKILAFFPEHPIALQKLAYLYLQTEAYPKAETLYLQLAEVSPQNPAVYTNLGLAFFHEKKFDEAIAAYEKAIALDPDRGARYANLGQVFFVIKDLEAATRCFQEASRRDPRNLNFLYLLGDTLLEAKHFVEAKKTYGRILDLSPYDEAAKEEVRRLTALGF